jgi:hypothetical protein
LQYFASNDDYRYELYKELQDINQPGKFPVTSKNHIELAKSKLLYEHSYDRPDSVLYMDRLPATIRAKKGFVYFFKYRTKKDDLTWKIASVGLVPEDPLLFEFDLKPTSSPQQYSSYQSTQGSSQYRFATFSDTRLKEDEPIVGQLERELKRILYARRKSAKEFFDKSQETDYQEVTVDVNED